MKPNFFPNKTDLNGLQNHLGHHFLNIKLLESALTHPAAFRNGKAPYPFKIHFQRLEFLGDRLLSAILGDAVFELFPDKREGDLSRAYMALSQRDTLADLAQQLSLPKFLHLGQTPLTHSILEDALEAIVGALFLDSDYLTTKQCVLSWFKDIPTWVTQRLSQMNSKGQLQEFIGERMHELQYKLVKAWGPIHQRYFCMAVFLGERCLAQATGISKHAAEAKAAALALALLKQESCSKEHPS